MRLTNELQKSANKMLKIYLKSTDTLLEVTDIVYAMGKAIGSHLGKKYRDKDSTRKRTADGGNRRECKLKKEMKNLDRTLHEQAMKSIGESEDKKQP